MSCTQSESEKALEVKIKDSSDEYEGDSAPFGRRAFHTTYETSSAKLSNLISSHRSQEY